MPRITTPLARPLALAASLLLAACTTACTTTAPRTATAPTAPAALRSFPAAGDRVRVMGRHVVEGSAVSFGAAGVTFFARFRGPALEVELWDEGRWGTGHDWFTAVVDGGAPTRFRADSGTRRYVVASGLSSGTHTLALSKATEGQNGRNRLVALWAESLLAPDPLPSRRIEFVGNSITAGYGADPSPVGCGQGTWYDQTHAWLSYAPRVARAVGAQWMLSAVSGIGMLRNWNSPGPTMPRVWAGVYMDYADTLTTWDVARYVPDLVVVGLGTNDFSDGGGPTPRPALDGDAFVRAYVGFVAALRERYPRARLLLVDSPMLDPVRKARQGEYLRRVVSERGAVGDTAISIFSFAGHYVAGCSAHPSLDEQRRMAEELEPAVRRAMGW